MILLFLKTEDPIARPDIMTCETVRGRAVALDACLGIAHVIMHSESICRHNCCNGIRLLSSVKIFTIPVPIIIQAFADKYAAPHIFLLPATISTFPKVPLLPLEILFGIKCISDYSNV